MKYSTFFIIIILLCFSISVLWGIAAGLFSDDPSFTIDSDNDVVRNYDRSINPMNNEIRKSNTGTITVTVNDNQVPTSANIRVYKNGEFIQSVHMSKGRYIFNGLEYGTYKFEVIDPDYTMDYYDANPSQLYFDYNVGEIELSPVINAVSYRIYGNIEGSTADPYECIGAGTGGVSWENVSISEIDDKLFESAEVALDLLNII